MNKQEFINKVSELGINLTEEQLVQLDTYCNFLLEYNSHTNLTAIKEEDQVYLKHFYDSLTFIKAIDVTKYNNLLDIGTGAGFPGLVLKIVFPELKIDLLDSTTKRCQFLQMVIDKLGLKDIEVINDRAENIISNHREKYDFATARAVAELRVLSEYCLPFVKKDGYFVSMKGSLAELEIENAQNALKVLSGKIEEKFCFDLCSQGERNIIKIKKISQIPPKYPRVSAQIAKKPL